MRQDRAKNSAYRVRVVRPARKPERGAFARLIRKTRQARGLTQDQLAVDSGVSRSTLARWENSELVEPERVQVEAVAGVLHIPLEDAYRALGWLPPVAGASGDLWEDQLEEALRRLNRLPQPYRHSAYVRVLRELLEQEESPERGE